MFSFIAFLLIAIFSVKLLQLKERNLQGYEVILVTSGAVGLGRQRLRYRRLANSR
jgi:glutamate 5-kinase